MESFDRKMLTLRGSYSTRVSVEISNKLATSGNLNDNGDISRILKGLEKISGRTRNRETKELQEIVHLGTSGFVLLTGCCPCDQKETNEMGGDCGTNGEEDRCIQGFGGEN